MSVQHSIQALSPSEAVVKRVAALEDSESTELVPLFEAVDPDALDALVDSVPGPSDALQIEFTYHGYEVTVTAEGVVHIDTNGIGGR